MISSAFVAVQHVQTHLDKDSGLNATDVTIEIGNDVNVFDSRVVTLNFSDDTTMQWNVLGGKNENITQITEG